MLEGRAVSRAARWRLALTPLLGLLVAAPARADEAPPTRPARYAIALATPGPLDACGGPEALAARVTTRLRRDALGSVGEADVVVTVDVDEALGARIVERDATGAPLGTREVALGHEGCAGGLETLAVVLAIMIGPERRVALPPAPTPAPPGPAPPGQAPRPPRLRFDEEPPLRLHASPLAEALVGTGVLPHVAAGVGLGIALFPPVARLSVLARAAYWPARSTETAAAAEVDRVGASLAGCYALLRLGAGAGGTGCLGLEAGSLHSSSAALTRPSERASYVDAFVEGRLGRRFVLGRDLLVEPSLGLQLGALLQRDRFTYRDRTGAVRTLLEPSPVALSASFGIVVHIL
ncbi:MAG: hypothetical protein JWP97_3374 [Labilithrix sp.]|nr:hypothetical protein [Labilithrix sp.]